MSSNEPFFKHPTAVIDEDVNIGEGSKIWHFSHIMKEVNIGSNCTLGQNSFLGVGVKAGNNVKIQNNVSIFEGVVIHNDVFIGPSVVFTNVLRPRSFMDQKNRYLSTIVETGVTIGANSTIVCGVHIESFSFIGAGSVVTQDVVSFAKVLGNPAKQVGWVSKFGYDLKFNALGTATCPYSNEQYFFCDNRVRQQ